MAKSGKGATGAHLSCQCYFHILVNGKLTKSRVLNLSTFGIQNEFANTTHCYSQYCTISLNLYEIVHYRVAAIAQGLYSGRRYTGSGYDWQQPVQSIYTGGQFLQSYFFCR